MENLERGEESILSRLKEIAVEVLEIDAEAIRQLRPELSLSETFHLDSIAQLLLLTEIEEDYGFLFEAEDADRLVTIADLVRIIRERAVRSPGGA